MELTSIVVRHARRIRLVFDSAVAAGAFGVNPTFYEITSNDSFGADPRVKAALIVPNSGNNVELALAADLAPGGRYTLTAIGVPAASGPASTIISTEGFVFGRPQTHTTDAEPSADDGELLLYGSDMVWTGTDFQETVSGDLALQTGAANAMAAVTRRCFANGLPWDTNYGAKPRQHVDGAAGASSTLRTTLMQQCLLDDRVGSVSVDYIPDDTFNIVVSLKGNRSPEAISMTVTSA